MRQKVKMPVGDNQCCAKSCTKRGIFHLLLGSHQYTGASYCSWAHAVEDGAGDLVALLDHFESRSKTACSCCSERARYHFYRGGDKDLEKETLTYLASFCSPRHFALYEDRVVADLMAVEKETR